MYMQIDAGELFYTVSNHETIDDGKPILFLIPGGPGLDHKQYKKAYSRLEDSFHIVYHDPRGCGLSTGFKSETYTMEKNINDIEALRLHLQFDSVAILGVSYGSMVALGYTIKFYKHLTYLILIAGACSYHFIDRAKYNLLSKGTSEQIKLCEDLLWAGKFSNDEQIQHFFQLMAPLYSQKIARSPNLSPYNNNKVTCAITPLNIAFRTNFWKFDYTPELKKICCPTLIISGDTDWINDPYFAKEMERHIPHSKLLNFRSGHNIILDDKDKLLDAIKNFRQEHSQLIK